MDLNSLMIEPKMRHEQMLADAEKWRRIHQLMENQPHRSVWQHGRRLISLLTHHQPMNKRDNAPAW